MDTNGGKETHMADLQGKDIQLQLERLSLEEPAARFRKTVEESKEKGRAHEIPGVRRLMKGQLTRLAREIQNTRDSYSNPTKTPLGIKAISHLDSETLSYLTLKSIFSNGYQPRGLTQCAVALGRDVEEEAFFKKVKDTSIEAWKFLKYSGITDDSARYFKGRRLKHASQTLPDFDWDKWDTKKRSHAGMQLINILTSKLGLVEITNITQGSMGRYNKRGVLIFTKEALKWLDEQELNDQVGHPLWFPMVEEPIEWSGMHDGGYLTLINPFVKPSSSRAPWEQDDEGAAGLSRAYQAVNIIQKTPWCVNQDILEVVEHCWKNSWRVKGIPETELLTPPPKPTDVENKKEDPEYRLWKKQAARVHAENYRITSKQISMVTTLRLAKMFRNYDCIYFPHNVDWRGRVYPIPVGLTPQGNEVQRALLTFAEAKPMDIEGFKWLRIHGASVAGLDKAPFSERLAWVDENEDVIQHIAEEPLDHLQWLHGWGRHPEVDKPLMFLAWCLDYTQALESGSSALPVSMDGTCNGLQHYSAALRDLRGAKATNLIPSDRPLDIYQEVADNLTEILEGDSENKRAREWLQSGLVTRTLTKRPTMTTPYAVTQQGIFEQTMELMHKWKAEGPLPFEGDAEGYYAAKYIYPKIVQAIEGVFPGAVAAMKALQQTSRILLKEGVCPRWETPTGFNVLQDYRTFKKREVRTTVNGRMRRFRLRDETDNLDKRKGASGIAPNVIHSLDAAHLMKTVIAMEDRSETPISYAMIHDSFGCHAADAPMLAEVLRDQFVEMYSDGNPLQQVLDDMKSRVPFENQGKYEWPQLPEMGDLDIESVKESKYFFA